jgi:hypothetical protein
MLPNELIQERVHPILKDLSQKLDVTSVWLCHFDFAKNCSIVVGEYANLDANPQESLSDLGETHHKSVSTWTSWLRTGEGYKSQHIDEMDRNDPDWLVYVECGVDSVAYFPVKIMGIVWGYVEVRESRGKRDFDTVEDAANMHNYSLKIGARLNQLFSEIAA